MKKNIVLLILVVSSFCLHSQTVVESFIGTDYFNIENWWSRSLDSNHKVNLFNYNDLAFDYSSENSLGVLSLVQLSYDLYKGLGPVAALRVNINAFDNYYRPHAGLQYVYFNERTMLSSQITAEIADNSLIEWFTIFNYFIPTKSKFDIFTQIKSTVSFRGGENEYSFQKLSLGFSKGKTQFGLGFNLFEYGPDWIVETQPGVFVRLMFD